MRQFVFYAWLILISCGANAQINYHALKINAGDRYRKTIYIRSNSITYRGRQTLAINRNSIVYKDYKVDDTLAGGISCEITIKKMADTIKAMGKQTGYSSDMPPDTSSFIQRALKSVTEKPARVNIDENEKISSVQNDYDLSPKDSVLSLSGLLPEKLIVGNTFELIASLPADRLLKKGAKWTDSVFTADTKGLMYYKVDNINDSVTTISFKGTEFKNYYNLQDTETAKYNLVTNISGKIVVDNNSAILKQRSTATATSGYEVINGVVVSFGKRTSVLEVVERNK